MRPSTPRAAAGSTARGSYWMRPRSAAKLTSALLTPGCRPSARSAATAHPEHHIPETAYFSVSGMWCSGCAVAAERALGRQPGVKSADVSFAAERGRIQYDPRVVEPAAALGVLGRMGYDARLLTEPGRRAS